MRSIHVEKSADKDILKDVGLTEEEAHEMYRLLAIANIEDRFVVPTGDSSDGMGQYHRQGSCGFPQGEPF